MRRISGSKEAQKKKRNKTQAIQNKETQWKRKEKKEKKK